MQTYRPSLGGAGHRLKQIFSLSPRCADGFMIFWKSKRTCVHAESLQTLERRGLSSIFFDKELYSLRYARRGFVRTERIDLTGRRLTKLRFRLENRVVLISLCIREAIWGTTSNR